MAIIPFFDTRIYKLEYTFEGLKNYYDISNNNIQNELNIVYERYKKEIKGIDKFDDIRKCEIDDIYADIDYDFRNTILKNFYYSFVMLIYSFLERAMLDLCLIIKNEKNIKIELNDLKDTGIIKAQTYLMKVCDSTFDEQSHEWQEIIKFNKIRNCIVHSEGNIEKTHNVLAIKNVIKNTQDITLVDDTYINISNVYIEKIIVLIENFLKTLYKDNL